MRRIVRTHSRWIRIFGLAILAIASSAIAENAQAQILVRRTIESSPPGATVYLDSTETSPLGTTPIQNALVRVGQHTLIFQLDGYKPLYLNVQNGLRGSHVIRGELEPLPSTEPVVKEDQKAAATSPSVIEAAASVFKKDRAVTARQFSRATLSEDAVSAESEKKKSGEKFEFEFHGYYRVRFVTTSDIPTPNTMGGKDGAANATYTFMRLRLSPSIVYNTPIKGVKVALRMAVNALQDVVFGDNARLGGNYLSTGSPSNTSLFGQEVPSVQLSAVWMHLEHPFGELNVGRIGLAGGYLGNVAFGDATSDWGDPQFESAYDGASLWAYPLAPLNDSKILGVGFGYATIVEDSLGLGVTPAPRNAAPYGVVTQNADDVHQVFASAEVAYEDKGDSTTTDDKEPRTAFGIAGTFARRWQAATDSRISVGIGSIQGHRRLASKGPVLFGSLVALTLQGPYTSPEGQRRKLSAWQGVFRMGVRHKLWTATLEAGYASGDGSPNDTRDTEAGISGDYRVGLLTFPVAYGSHRGDMRTGVQNSRFLFPQMRVRPERWLELVGAVVLAWADALSPDLYNARPDGSTSCGMFSGDCFLGWEGDLGVHIRTNDKAIRWTTEFGFMHAGKPLSGMLTEPWLWTGQSRVAFVW